MRSETQLVVRLSQILIRPYNLHNLGFLQVVEFHLSLFEVKVSVLLKPVMVHLLPLKVDLSLYLILGPLLLLLLLFSTFSNLLVFVICKQVRNSKSSDVLQCFGEVSKGFLGFLSLFEQLLFG